MGGIVTWANLYVCIFILALHVVKAEGSDTFKESNEMGDMTGQKELDKAHHIMKRWITPFPHHPLTEFEKRWIVRMLCCLKPRELPHFEIWVRF